MKQIYYEILPESKMNLIKIISINKDNGTKIAFLPYLRIDNNRIENLSKVDDLILDSVKMIYPNSFVQWDKKLFYEDEQNKILFTLFQEKKEIIINFLPDINSNNINEYINLSLPAFEFSLFLRVKNQNDNEYIPDFLCAKYPVKETKNISDWLDSLIIL